MQTANALGCKGHQGRLGMLHGYPGSESVITDRSLRAPANDHPNQNGRGQTWMGQT